MKLWHFIFIIIFYNQTLAQQRKAELINTIELEADTFVGMDDLNHLYYINNNILYKKSKDGTLNYGNMSLGRLTLVDIHNPFKIILFYKDFNSVIILDSKLNELSNAIDLTKETQYNNVKLVSHSSENNLWLYADDNKLHLFDYSNYSEKIQSQPFSFYHENFEPRLIKSSYKNVWVLGASGIIQLNEYGNFISYIEIDGLDDLFPFQTGIIYVKNDEFSFYYEHKSSEISIEIRNSIQDIHVNNSSLSIFDGSKVYQYQIM